MAVCRSKTELQASRELMSLDTVDSASQGDRREDRPAWSRRTPKVVSERVNSLVRVIEEHYDKPSQREEMEERRRQHLDRLEFNGGDDDE